ncbi:Hypothetical protein NTJ_07617 [Nesidiocoris tenuis]|uniref:Uncharacterized protein n=1 Tax=Nesidiocoris tenuis TaxID=355587 RepID=A0ABN7AS87_9HEMI|nr:Hypothetical protein NTJ_07617 [Nesidiocoris tenuis]
MGEKPETLIFLRAEMEKLFAPRRRRKRQPGGKCPWKSVKTHVPMVYGATRPFSLLLARPGAVSRSVDDDDVFSND